MTEDKQDIDFISRDRLPHGWQLLPLKHFMAGDKTAIRRGPFGSAIKKSFFVAEGYKVYEQKNAIYDDATLGNYFIDAEKFDELRDFEAKPGDFIISCSGTIGRISRLPPNAQPGVINQALLKLTIDEGRVLPKYFLYLFRSRRLQQLVLKDTRGSAMKNLASVEDLKEIRLPLPPIKQQEAIVAEIEKQFSRLDEAVTNLKRVKANLKRYKAAVLKAAVEGKLVPTEAELAREENRSFETGAQLLGGILNERRRRWKGKERYKEPAAADTANLPALPDGWMWVTLPQLGELNRGKSKHRPRDDTRLYDGPYPFIQTGDIRKSAGTIREHSQTYSELGLQQSRLWPRGTLCITIAANIAETGILTYPACFPDSVVGFIFAGDQVTTRYIEFFLRTAKERLERFAPATAQKNINLNVLKNVAIPLPPFTEQHRLVAEVERCLSVMEELETVVNANLQRAARLRQTILRGAFEGGFRNS
jgi:restriction endonuclease S subunit